MLFLKGFTKMKTIEEKLKLKIAFEDKEINVLPPKMRVVNKWKTLKEDTSEDEIYNIVAETLSNNVEKQNITIDYLLDVLDMSDFNDLIKDITTYMVNIQKN